MRGKHAETAMLARVRSSLRSFVADYRAVYSERLASYFGDVPETKEVWRFDDSDALASWSTSTDKEWGGSSRCSWTVEEVEDGKRVAVLQGEINKRSRIRRLALGFCEVKAELPRTVRNSRLYDGIAVRVRTDGKLYGVSMTSASWFPDDVHMAYLQPEAGEWKELEMPFRYFAVTANGFPRVMNRMIDVTQLQTFGFRFISEEDGPFRLEVESVALRRRCHKYRTKLAEEMAEKKAAEKKMIDDGEGEGGDGEEEEDDDGYNTDEDPLAYEDLIKR
eukprot:PLAT15525.1.p1 GENE.PLAT15525.1~~PLAT15525.1.p1  ORF type:complete len:277 (+),score=100.31 PLAT15525.1:309-1139(+)